MHVGVDEPGEQYLVLAELYYFSGLDRRIKRGDGCDPAGDDADGSRRLDLAHDGPPRPEQPVDRHDARSDQAVGQAGPDGT